MRVTRHTYHIDLSFTSSENAVDSLEALLEFVRQTEHDVLKFKWAAFAADHAVTCFLVLILHQDGMVPVMKKTKRGVKVIDFWEAFKAFKKRVDSMEPDGPRPPITQKIEDGIRLLHDVVRNELWHYQPNLVKIEHPMDYVGPLGSAVDLVDIIQRTLLFRIVPFELRDRTNSIVQELRSYLGELESDHNIVQSFYKQLRRGQAAAQSTLM